MMRLLKFLQPFFTANVGWFAVLAALGLTAVGIAAIDTATATDGLSALAKKQAVFVVVALGGMVLFALVHHRLMVPMAYPLLLVAMVLLVIILLPFMPREIVPVRNGARRWFDLQIALVQPSELAKIAYILALACYLRYRDNFRSLRGLLFPLVATFVPMGLILVEPDLGTAMLLLPIFFAMMIAAGAKLKHIIMIVLIGVMLVPALYPLLRPHQKRRIDAMIAQLAGDASEQDRAGFQGHRARMLVGAGGEVGHTPNYAKALIRFNGLPEPHNDMVFAVICTRWGLAGGAVVMLLYLILLGSGLAAAALNKDPFARLVAVGVVAVIFTQMTVNIGMTIGLLPITGMTLPFVSYGGSSLVTNFAMVGLILNVAVRRPIIMAEPSFEYGGRSRSHVQRGIGPGA